MLSIPSTPLIAMIVLLAGVLLAIFALLSPSHHPTYAQEAMDEPIEYPENGTDSVAAFTAMDPEGEDIAWTWEGADADDFSIVGGVLTFNSPPDFENPADAGTDNVYNVTVVASDGGGTSTPDMETVTVTVTNVDEDGDITLSTLQPLEGVDLTAMLTDLDGQPNRELDTINTDLTDLPETTKWQWSRSSNVDGPWTDIEVTGGDGEPVPHTKTYTPGPDDVGHYLRATARYTDGHSPTPDADNPEDPDKIEHMVSDNLVLKNLVNDAPVFNYTESDEIPDDDPVVRKVDENSASGASVGAPVVAYDDDGDVLTYRLEPTTGFTIDRSTGQIKVGTTLDFETTATYEVMVTAMDPSGLDDEIDVTINVTNVDEDPSIADEGATLVYPEIKTNSPNTDTVFTYAATDPEDTSAADLEWSLSGSDRGQFEISDSGALTFESPPDFEAPSDSGRNNIYNVTVVVTDSSGNTDSRDVTVTIENVGESGTVTLTSHPQPEIDQTIRVELDDPDGPTSGSVTWEWQIGTTTFTQSRGNKTASYTPRVADIQGGQGLSVTATYADGFDVGNSVSLQSPPTVQEKDPNDPDPTFLADAQTTFDIAENTTGILSSIDVQATDNDTLLYTLSGRDASFFTIDAGNGQISVGAGTALDHETKPTYTVTVIATDPSGDSATITVTINITNEEENPSITAGPTEIDYPENGTGAVGTYRATDPENDRARPRLPLMWELSNNDNDQLEINTTSGVLTHQSIWRDGQNLFAGDGYAGTSQLMRHYIGGLLRHSPAIMALCAPTTNSYRRLVPGFEAPVNLAYSARNRSACCRIPMYFSDPGSRRVEYRCLDGTANPYLAFAAMLMAGIAGIINKIDPGEPLDVNIYDLTPEQSAEVQQVPGSLAEALDALEADNEFLLRSGVFTSDLIDTWISYKRSRDVAGVQLRPHPYEFMLYYDA